MHEARTQLMDLVREKFPDSAEEIDKGASFESAGMDSLGVVELLLWMQRHFGASVQGDELSPTSTLDEALKLL